MYILCYTVKIKKENLLPDEYEFHSDWAAYETMAEAEAVFEWLLKRKDLYTASIAEVVKSTDYKNEWMPATVKCLDCGESFKGEHQCKITYKL